MAIRNHPLRERIVAEMHLRRMPPLAAPACILQTVRLLAPADREAERAHILAMPGVAPGDRHIAARDASGRSADGTELLWERHSEASTATLITPAAAGDAFAPAAAPAAIAWLEQAPGEIIRATRIALVPDEAAAEALLPQLRFEPVELVSCRLGATRIWSDFRLWEDGYGRLLVAAGDVAPTDLGRLVQRVQELGNYRNLALMGLPLAQAESERLGALEHRLAEFAAGMAQAGADAALLDELCRLSAEVAAVQTGTGFRMSATAAYARIAQDRLAALPCTGIPGCLTLNEFTERRLAPAIRTCASFSARLDALSTRIERATSLLQTRVEIAMQAQNVALLRSVDANAARQLRLQHLVEGLSVIAVSYYALGLLAHVFPLLAHWWGVSDDVLGAAALLPVLLLVGLYLRWETHRVVHEPLPDPQREPVAALD